MHTDGSSTSAVLSGNAELERHEEILLDQMTAVLPVCPECGCDGFFLTAWSPLRTVHRIICAVCFHTFWEAP